MTETSSETGATRVHRRKARSRSSLISAAQDLLATNRTQVPVSEITDAADVGVGTFYNHFSSKDELFEAAILDAVERHGALMDDLCVGIEDPAVAFAQSFRLTGRLHRSEPQLSKVLLSSSASLLTSSRGLAPRALRDILAGIAKGRFTVSDPELALVVVAGAVVCLGQLLHQQPDRDDAAAADIVAEDLLRMLGLDPREARKICELPLPTSGS